MKTTLFALWMGLSCLVQAEGVPVDPALAKQALVVLRAKRVSEASEADKYRWYEVQVLEVFENRAEQIFPATPIKVAVLSVKPGIPAGVSTLYLVRYNESEKNDLWKLVGGGAATGVSHPAN
jgi:hypothetical protein